MAEHKSGERLLVQFQMENSVVLGGKVCSACHERSNTRCKRAGKLPVAVSLMGRLSYSKECVD